MARLFGTDGVRGVANDDLTPALAYKLGQAAVAFLGQTIVVGKDTRLSGDMLEAALVSGITAAGGCAYLAGVIPTPAVALLVRKLSAAGGVVISASHNPPEYNGIKFFDANGFKLPDEVEDRIEEFIVAGGLEKTASQMPVAGDVGFSIPLKDATDIYVEHVVSSVAGAGLPFEGLTIALDTGHGASSITSPEALRRLGAKVHAINTDFDGMDINVECGSTHLAPLKELVSQTSADVGIAHDGDADRVMMVASDGAEIDGDTIEAVCAIDMKDRGVLSGNTAVTTVMCNLGFVHAMRDAGIEVIQTKVGDRYVLEEMRAKGFSIGGEQSGHMILLDHNSTGDGLMSAVQFLAAVLRSGKSVTEAARLVTKFPQELINVKVTDKHGISENAQVQDAVRAAEEALGEDGRVLLRPSGTEPVIRVMVEAAREEDARRHAEAIARVIEEVS